MTERVIRECAEQAARIIVAVAIVASAVGAGVVFALVT